MSLQKDNLHIARPALVVYSFAPKHLPNSPNACEEARRYLEHLWDACSRLGMCDPVTELNLPTAFPGEVGTKNPAFQVVAAKIDMRRRAERSDYQAFIFEYQDVVGLVATLESGDEGVSLERWQELHHEWARQVGDIALPKGMLGETFLFSALCGDAALLPPDSWISASRHYSDLAMSLGGAIFSELPGSIRLEKRAAAFYITDQEFWMWEGEPLKARRVIALFAPRAKVDALFGWTVWLDDVQLAPFARYLMHVSKLHFARNVFEEEINDLRQQRQEVEDALNDLLRLHQKIVKSEFVDVDELAKAQSQLHQAQAGSYGLLFSLSRMRELHLTVQIAERNLTKNIPPPHPDCAQVSHSLFGQDSARAVWLREQIQNDIGYLEALHERAEEGYKLTALQLEHAGQKNARRLNDLVLLQGTLLSALLGGLAAIQAFGLQRFWHESLSWPLVFFIIALALTLPPLFTHWHVTYHRVEYLIGALFGAALVWLGVSFWAAYLPVFFVPYQVFLLFHLGSVVAGLLLGYWGVGRLERFKRERRRALEQLQNQ